MIDMIPPLISRRSCPRILPSRTRYTRRSPCGSIYPQRLRERKTSVLPPTTEHRLGRIQRRDPGDLSGTRSREETSADDTSRQGFRNFHPSKFRPRAHHHHEGGRQFRSLKLEPKSDHHIQLEEFEKSERIRPRVLRIERVRWGFETVHSEWGRSGWLDVFESEDVPASVWDRRRRTAFECG